MLRELLSIFRKDQPLEHMGNDFAQMLRLIALVAEFPQHKQVAGQRINGNPFGCRQYDGGRNDR